MPSLEMAATVQASVAPQATASTLAGDEELKRLAETLHTVKRFCPTLPVLGIRWMHIRHPLHAVQEALLGKSWSKSPARRTILLRRLLQSFLSMIYLTAQLIRLRWSVRRDVDALRQEQFVVIMKSCAYGAKRLAGDRDFYFGDLQQRLEARGVKTLLLCNDVLEEWDWVAFAQGHTTRSPIGRLPELALVPPYVPLIVWGQQLLACIRLRGLARRGEDPMTTRVSLLAAQDCLAPDTALSALSYWVGRYAVRQWHPKVFLTMYEGHAWEACLRLGVTHEDASCHCVGYQHTVLFHESFALQHPTSDTIACTVPDVVLGLGPVPLELMRPGHEPYGTRLVNFGSFRYRSHEASEPGHPQQRTILVTPEGHISETSLLFRFTVECAKRLPEYTFIVRCHPEVPMKQALRLVPGLLELPNIVRSEHQAIEEDFERASVLLYRGSSTVMYAVLHGLRPIYYDVPGTRDRDPLYAMPVWRQRCATVEECMARIEQDAIQPVPQRVAEWRAASEYVHGCTGPVTHDRIEAFLQSVGLDGQSA